MAEEVEAMASGKILRPSNGLVRVIRVLFEVTPVTASFDLFRYCINFSQFSVTFDMSTYVVVIILFINYIFQLNYFCSIFRCAHHKICLRKVQQELFFPSFAGENCQL